MENTGEIHTNFQSNEPFLFYMAVVGGCQGVGSLPTKLHLRKNVCSTISFKTCYVFFHMQRISINRE